MKKRGGGVKQIKVRRLVDEKNVVDDLDEMVSIDVLIDVCESMGANIINTVLEQLSPFVQILTGGRIGLRILSNLCVERLVRTSFEIPVMKMGWKNVEGSLVA